MGCVEIFNNGSVSLKDLDQRKVTTHSPNEEYGYCIISSLTESNRPIYSFNEILF